MLHSTSQIYLVLQHCGIIDSFVPRFLQRIFPFILFHFVAMLYQLVIVLYNYTIQFYCCQIYTASGKK